MNNTVSKLDIKLNTSRNPPRRHSRFLHNIPRLPIYILSISILVFVLFQIYYLQTPQTSTRAIANSCLPTFPTENPKSAAAKLRRAITFLPLKDLRYKNAPMKGHTWFMSSLHDVHEEGEVQYQQFPMAASEDRLLCVKGRDKHDGSWNSYALAYPQTLPDNATMMKGITFVSYNHYDYNNIWHGLSALMPFVAWHIKNQCEVPERWVLYHWGELRSSISPWVRTLLEATFGGSIRIETFDHGDGSDPSCFEEAVVMRHNEGGMSREKRMEVYDLMRCKSRMYCNVSSRDEGDGIGMTVLMRVGTRSFRNESAVVGIFERECRKVEGCYLMVAYIHNLTVCEQVKLMSRTDVLVSPHGAQLTNIFLMDRNSSVMELFPKGWLETAGVGQYVYHWIASWSGMRHEGVWRDSVGDHCSFPEDDRRCMSVFKNGRIGHNETYFAEWSGRVLREKVGMRKNVSRRSGHVDGLCGCSSGRFQK